MLGKLARKARITSSYWLTKDNEKLSTNNKRKTTKSVVKMQKIVRNINENYEHLQ